jgi:hypothetical protein
MKEKTKEYMAGLMDAEGCFTITRCFRKASNCYNYLAQIIFTNTNPELMKWVVFNFGGVYKKRKVVSGNKQAYDWKVTNQKHALSFISTILPYLIVKKAEAVLMIKYYELNGKECSEIREQLFDEIKRLKWNKGSVTTDMPNASNAYCAGFFDGDGGVSGSYTLTITNTHRGVVDLFCKQYGGYFYEHTSIIAKQSDYFRWTLNNRQKVKLILLSWIPYLIDKKDRAKIALIKVEAKIQSELASDCKSDLVGTLKS